MKNKVFIIATVSVVLGMSVWNLFLNEDNKEMNSLLLENTEALACVQIGEGSGGVTVWCNCEELYLDCSLYIGNDGKPHIYGGRKEYH